MRARGAGALGAASQTSSTVERCVLTFVSLCDLREKMAFFTRAKSSIPDLPADDV